MTVSELEKRVLSLEKELEEARSAIRRNSQETSQVLGITQKLRDEVSNELKKVIIGVNDVIKQIKNPVSIDRG